MRLVFFVCLSVFCFTSCRQWSNPSGKIVDDGSVVKEARTKTDDELPIRDSIPSPLTGSMSGFWKGQIHCNRFVNLYDTTQVLEKETRVNFYYDDSGFLFTTYAEEEDVRYTHTERDSKIWEDPCVEIFFDPGNDGENYYELEINALPQVWDLKLKSNQAPINGPDNILPWDIGTNFGLAEKNFTPNDDSDIDKNWGVIGTLGWDAFAEGKPKAGDRWAYNFMRVDYDKEGKATYWVAKSTGEVNIHHPSTWPVYTF